MLIAGTAVAHADARACASGPQGPRCDHGSRWRQSGLVEIGAYYLDLPLEPLTITGYDRGGHSRQLPATRLGSLSVTAFHSELGDYIGPLYVGVNLDLGHESIGHTFVASDPTNSFGVAGTDVYGDIGLTLGVRLPQLGRFTVEPDVSASFALFPFTPDGATRAGYPCDADGCDAPGIGVWLVEPRLRIQAWIDPALSIDAWGTAEVLPGLGGWSAGIALGLHLGYLGGW